MIMKVLFTHRLPT